ncbi:hypothetical protein QM467_03220 [Rhodoblastus sp. 17X3]|nr:hypothetical protein [Rhodoblastus sp. 17X3]MDI9847069.1 hypothetical protein [Rhodoblastus sp. 17X3]
MNDGPSSPAINVFDAIAGFPNQTNTPANAAIDADAEAQSV